MSEVKPITKALLHFKDDPTLKIVVTISAVCIYVEGDEKHFQSRKCQIALNGRNLTVVALQMAILYFNTIINKKYLRLKEF